MAGKVTVGLVESNRGPTTRFMTNVICGLTVEKPGSAACSVLIIKYKTTLLFKEIYCTWTICNVEVPPSEYR